MKNHLNVSEDGNYINQANYAWSIRLKKIDEEDMAIGANLVCPFLLVPECINHLSLKFHNSRQIKVFSLIYY